jgi:hypothetical protein
MFDRGYGIDTSPEIAEPDNWLPSGCLAIMERINKPQILRSLND